MKYSVSIVFVFILILIASCENDTGKSESTPQKKEEQETEVAQTPVETSSSLDEFIASFTKARKDAQLKADIVLTNENFSVINFEEKHGDHSYEYAITINPEKEVTKSSDFDGIYDDVFSSLKKQNITFNLYIGKMNLIRDLNYKESEDFILTHLNNYRTTFSGESRLFLYDGKSNLMDTKIVAKNDFEEGECDYFIGYKEEILFNKHYKDGTLRTDQCVTIYREENIASSPDCNDTNVVKLKYNKTWEWQGDQYQNAYRVHNMHLDDLPDFKKIPKKFIFLEKEKEEYVVKEHCQNGGANSYEIAKANQDDMYCYNKNTTSDDIEDHFLAGFKQLDASTFALYWRPTHSMDFEDNFDAIENEGVYEVVILKQDKEATDRYSFHVQENKYNPLGEIYTTTVAPDNYPFIKCNY